ncbi:hypothetical protein BABINDRAFT_161138 [Babjeviella inositovora NRRL Y-12698]|uniref:Zn(2)-C6 fungal-type domain-containing protein n=1 Tax=Babjeviella inositovora NRRL Y-12698 TaxID=984486 RepID=A0A1E3QR16_9ASCO|nr:uncharacterized protein BABINDRAFT_161138 [Babjeviella inositovora NRRL Y-12698]ODQ80156.1 hypothetical protein BABINDRAFT_161138 [Babjeviella inositovora NRRL Y-12698]
MTQLPPVSQLFVDLKHTSPSPPRSNVSPRTRSDITAAVTSASTYTEPRLPKLPSLSTSRRYTEPVVTHSSAVPIYDTQSRDYFSLTPTQASFGGRLVSPPISEVGLNVPRAGSFQAPTRSPLDHTHFHNQPVHHVNNAVYVPVITYVRSDNYHEERPYNHPVFIHNPQYVQRESETRYMPNMSQAPYQQYPNQYMHINSEMGPRPRNEPLSAVPPHQPFKREIKRRTRSGCLTCRKRRIKCDERKPFCLNCEKSKKCCSGFKNLNVGNKPSKKDTSSSPSSSSPSGDEA